jgi:hypothetical protein
MIDPHWRDASATLAQTNPTWHKYSNKNPEGTWEMAVTRVEAYKHRILEKLRRAAIAGLTKRALGVRSSSSAAGRALKALEQEFRVGNLGSRSRTRYVLAEYFKPLELACRALEVNALAVGKTRPLTLMTRRELEKGCEGQVRRKTAEALDWLIKRGLLVRFRRGNAFYYAHPACIARSLPAKAPVVAGEGAWTKAVSAK